MIKRGNAFRCINCGNVNVFNSKYSDGVCCMKCNGALVPMGEAIVKESNKKVQGLSVKFNVDTTELDAALEKAKLLKDTTEDHKKVLIIQAKALIREEDVKAEEDRIKSITGMRVCIINSRYEVVGIETELNNG